MGKRNIKFNLIMLAAITVIISACGSKIENSSVDYFSNSDSSYTYEKINKGYYLNCITSEKQINLYNLILSAYQERAEEVNLGNIDEDLMKLIKKCVLNDHPELYYVSGEYGYIKNYINEDLENYEIVFYPQYSMTYIEQQHAEKEIQEYTNQVLSLIDEGMEDYEKEKVIYDYIVQHTEYVLDSDHNQDLYSVVKGKSVCMGISRMFQYLCNQIGIECTIVTGADENGTNHAWNCIKLEDKEWYMVDVTSSYRKQLDNKTEGNTKEITYYYFNITKEQLLRSYSINNVIETPACDSYKQDYFFKNDRYYETADIKRLIKQIKEIDANENLDNEIEIRCRNTEILHTLYDYLITERVIYNDFDFISTAKAMPSDRLLIIKLTWQRISDDK